MEIIVQAGLVGGDGLFAPYRRRNGRKSRLHRLLLARRHHANEVAIHRHGDHARKFAYGLGVKRQKLSVRRGGAHDAAEQHAGQFDVCSLFSSRFRSVIAQFPTELQLIPAQIASGEQAVGSSYSYEPDEEEILSTLLPRNISTQVYSALLENAASEQGARMSAMDNATRNAGEMIKKQTMQYNRTRQAMITKELIEIISGAEAL